ncbi:MAG: endonuclease III domain-containing protein [Thermoanaerobaculia bacterium]
MAAPLLPKVLDLLASRYGQIGDPPPKTAFEMILFENVAYLADDGERRKSYALLAKSVGTKPQAILEAPFAALRAIAAYGILPDRFAGKLREAARIAVEEFEGDFEAAMEGPVPSARKALRKFPGIGEPGADRILLFTGRHASLAPESNALRVLTRLGIIHEEKSYAAGYSAAQKAAAKELGTDFERLRQAHRLLRRHGQVVCRRGPPECDKCPVAPLCEYFRARA